MFSHILSASIMVGRFIIFLPPRYNLLERFYFPSLSAGISLGVSGTGRIGRSKPSCRTREKSIWYIGASPPSNQDPLLSLNQAAFRASIVVFATTEPRRHVVQWSPTLSASQRLVGHPFTSHKLDCRSGSEPRNPCSLEQFPAPFPCTGGHPKNHQRSHQALTGKSVVRSTQLEKLRFHG